GEHYRQDLISLEEALNDCFRSTNMYLSCVDKIDSYPTSSKGERDFKKQMQLTFLSFLGSNARHTSLLAERETTGLDHNISEKISNEENDEHSWMDKVLESAKDQKIIMFNENHFCPNHRTALTLLLKDLFSMGYTYLALEGLIYDELDPINIRDEIRLEDGFYTREPQFIQLIRLARLLGMTLVS